MGELDGELERGAGRTLHNWARRLEGVLDGAAGRQKDWFCWSGSWSGGEDMLERDWTGRKSWSGDRSGGALFIAKRCFGYFCWSGRWMGGSNPHDVTRDWRGDWSGVSEIFRYFPGGGLERVVPIHVPSNFLRAV